MPLSGWYPGFVGREFFLICDPDPTLRQHRVKPASRSFTLDQSRVPRTMRVESCTGKRDFLNRLKDDSNSNLWFQAQASCAESHHASRLAFSDSVLGLVVFRPQSCFHFGVPFVWNVHERQFVDQNRVLWNVPIDFPFNIGQIWRHNDRTFTT